VASSLHHQSGGFCRWSIRTGQVEGGRALCMNQYNERWSSFQAPTLLFPTFYPPPPGGGVLLDSLCTFNKFEENEKFTLSVCMAA